MKKGKVDMVIVGSDRIAANGDVANKIGTYEKAVLAKENNIPFYVAAPTSTIDMNCESGDKIPIEDGVQRYILTEKGMSFFDENEDVMEDVRKRLDAVEFPFMNLFQKQPHFRSYFMRISRFMMVFSELPEEKWNSELMERLDKVLASSAYGLEAILNDAQK